MLKIKSLLIALAIFFTTITVAQAWQYDKALPVAGKTITTQDMQMKSLFTIYSFGIRAASPSCQTFSIADTKVSKAKKDGSWEEIWSIKACEKIIDVPVAFIEKANNFSYTVNPMRVKVRQ